MASHPFNGEYHEDKQLERGDVFEAWVMPFVRVADWVVEHPNSKRLPNGTNFGGQRMGFKSLERFCFAYRNLMQDCPNLVAMLTDDERAKIDRVFALESATITD